MINIVKTIIIKFLDNRLLPGEDAEVVRKVHVINGAVAVFIFGILASILYDWLLFSSISTTFQKVVLLIVAVRFLFWHRGKKNVRFNGNLLLASIVLGLVWSLITSGLGSPVFLMTLVLPIFAYILGGIELGFIWSLFVFVWVNVIWMIPSPDRGLVGNGRQELMDWFTYSGVYVAVWGLSAYYETIRSDIENKFAAKNNELVRLIYVISHDLRNPLTSFKGFFSFIKEDIKEKNLELLKRDIQKTEMVIKSMEQMINELLNLSRIGKGDATKEKIDTGEVVKTLLAENESQFKSKDIVVEVVGSFPEMTIDKRKFLEVVRNLVSNAIKYIGRPKDPRITVGVNENAFDYHFYVRDNGIGVKAEDQGKIFELFYQGAGQNKESSGIGLSVVKGFIEDMGGKVWVESKEGQGSTFWFSIPKLKN